MSKFKNPTNPSFASLRRRRDADAEAEAEADPEADPWLYYSHVPAYPYHAHPYHPAPLAYTLPAPLHFLHSYYRHVGCTNYLGAAVPCAL